MATKDLEGKRALVTGASSGLGVAFARLLAARGATLVIAARREDKLRTLAEELRKAHGVEVHVVAVDLFDPGAPERIFAETEGAGRPIDILINNAGGGTHSRFTETPWARVASQIQLNVIALTELTHRYARAMLARGRGHILNVSSIGAYTPTPTLAVYSASKAFVRDMTEAIAHELAGSPVRVCCLCPGGTFTEFHLAAGQAISPLLRFAFMSAERCAAIGLSALFSGRRNVVSGLINKLSMFLLRFMPRRLVIWTTALTMGEPRAGEGT